MRLNRRGFLGALGAAIAGATLDPERALWVPGSKLISIPAPSRYAGFPWRYDGIVLTTTATPEDVERWIRARFLAQAEVMFDAPDEIERWVSERCLFQAEIMRAAMRAGVTA